MNLRQLLAVLLLVAGVLALVYRGFSYTTRSRQARLGRLEVAVQRQERVAVPVWVGVVLIGAGAGLLLVGRK